MTEKAHLSLKFTQLQKVKQIPQNSVPKIQRVAHYLRDRKHFAKHYSPKFLSIGPIHYGAKNLQLGEKYKLMWAARYLERTEQDAQILYENIKLNIEQLKELFAEDVIGDFPDDEKLSWMLLVDGCSLLQILEKGKLDYPEEMNVKVDQLVLVWQDVLLLENQLPYQVLKLLSGPENEAKLLKSMNKFLKCHHLSPVKPDEGTKDEDSAFAELEGYTSVSIKNEDTLEGELRVEIPQERPPFHLLDQFRRTIVHDPQKNQKKDTTSKKKKSKQNTNKDFDNITYRNIQELRAAGIRLKKSNSRRLKDISFSCGWLYRELKLPEITVDDTTAPIFLNLVAYEMCQDFRNDYEICSFVAFMDSLIDHPGDVKELRSAGILLNMLGSDEEVANLFNTISTDLVSNMEEEEGYSHCKTWIALGYYTYFSNPWAIIGFMAAVFAILLTFIQTWYAIHPAHAG